MREKPVNNKCADRSKDRHRADECDVGPQIESKTKPKYLKPIPLQVFYNIFQYYETETKWVNTKKTKQRIATCLSTENVNHVSTKNATKFPRIRQLKFGRFLEIPWCIQEYYGEYLFV